MTARSPTMVTLHDTVFECRWWNDGWIVKTRHWTVVGLHDTGPRSIFHCVSIQARISTTVYSTVSIFHGVRVVPCLYSTKPTLHNVFRPSAYVTLCLYLCALYFCICTCSAQLSMFHTERHSRNTLIVIIITTIIIIIIIIIIHYCYHNTVSIFQCLHMLHCIYHHYYNYYNYYYYYYTVSILHSICVHIPWRVGLDGFHRVFIPS